MYLMITVNRYAHFQTLTKTPAKLLKDSTKKVGDVALTRYSVPICVGRM